MRQVDAVLGGTPSLGPVHGYGGGGGASSFRASPLRVLNYTAFQLSDRDYFVIRNEWWRDEEGEGEGWASRPTTRSTPSP